MGFWGRLKGRGKEGPRIIQKRRRALPWVDALERYGEAAGIAQEGQREQARNLVLEHLLEPRKILVVTGQDGGSLWLRDYAFSLAARMGCEIWHLVCSEAGPPSTFQNNAWSKAQVPCKEMFLQGDSGSCVQQALAKLKRVEFVLMEREHSETLQLPVPVFTVLNPATS